MRSRITAGESDHSERPGASAASAAFLCTYIGRMSSKNRRPFRFIVNHSQATAPNVYLLLYPKGYLAEMLNEDIHLKRRIWQLLKAIRIEELLSEGRVYGGGLYKLEPGELGKVQSETLAQLLSAATPHEPKRLRLFEKPLPYSS